MQEKQMTHKSPIRVAQIVGKVDFGGVDVFVMNYYRHIDRNIIQFDFFMDGLNPTPIDDEIISLGGRVFKLPAYTDSMRDNLKVFRNILKQNSYTIIHCHMNTLSVFWLREAKRAGIPVRISHSHSQSMAYWGEGFRTVMKYMLRPLSKIYPTHYFACGEYAGRWLFGNRLFDTGKVSVIRIGRDIDAYRFNADARNNMRNELGLQDKFVVGHVGRFMHQKNHKYLVEVFAEVHKKHSDAVLMLVGDGELRSEIERQVDAIDLRDSVLFIGSRRDVNDLYQSMDVFVLPSWYEGFPAVLVEAQIAGLPCVVSDSVAKECAICEDYAAISLREGVETWAERILSFVNTPRKNRASEFRAKGYDIKDAARKLAEMYMEMSKAGI